MLKSLQHDFVVTIGLFVMVAVLLVVLIRDLGEGLPAVPVATGVVERLELPGNLRSPEVLFVAETVVAQGLSAGEVSGFHTTQFEPPRKPPRQAPTTRKVELTYLGFLQAGDGPRTAMVLEGKRQWIGEVGSPVVADVVLMAIDPGFLMVTNSAGQTNRLEFRNKTTLEVPVK